MPPKKKKTQLKPVARGFATTSQPKKVVQEALLEPAAESTTAPASNESTTSEGKDRNETTSNINPNLAEFNPELVEEQSLQNLVDKLQEKTEREISRCMLSLSLP